MSEQKNLNTGDLVIERHFHVPVDKIWKAWTDPEIMKKWWGPKGFTSPVAKIDLRIGGRFINSMRGPDGKDTYGVGTYQEIVPFKKIVVTDSFADDKGNAVPATYYGMEDVFPMELRITVTFTEEHGHTLMKLVHSGMPLGRQMEDARDGWSSSFDKLEHLLME